MEYYELFRGENVYKTLKRHFDNKNTDSPDFDHCYVHIFKNPEGKTNNLVGKIYVDIDFSRCKAYVGVYQELENGVESCLVSKRISTSAFKDPDDVGYALYREAFDKIEKEWEEAILDACKAYYDEIREKSFSVFVKQEIENQIKDVANRWDIKVLSNDGAKELESQGKDYQILNIHTKSIANTENLIIKLDTAQYHKAEELKKALLSEIPSLSNIQIYNSYEVQRGNVNSNKFDSEKTIARRRR